MREEVLLDLFHGFIPPDSVEEQWDVEGLERAIFSEFGQKIPVEGWLAEDEGWVRIRYLSGYSLS